MKRWKTSGVASVGVVTLLVSLLLAIPGYASAPTRIVSETAAGQVANAQSDRPHLSADGRFVAFESAATNLVAGDTNGFRDVFVKDLSTGAVERISLGDEESQGDDYSTLATISGDGRYVAFQSWAQNLVTGDTNTSGDIFVRDRLEGRTHLVSVSRTGGPAWGTSTRPSISDDGRYVAFNSSAANLVTGDGNGAHDIFVRDMHLGQTERVSLGVNGAEPNGASMRAELRGDGRYVAFESTATNLVSNDTNGKRDIFLHDRGTGQTQRVNVAVDGGSSIGEGHRPHLTPDGRFVAFQTRASDIVTGDTNDALDVFVRDMHLGATTLVSRSSTGAPGAAASTRAVLSHDGRFVAFESHAANLVSGDTNGQGDIFLRDLQAGSTTRISVTSAGGQPNGWSYRSEISADGRRVIYRSSASNLVPHDTNGVYDIFAVDAAVALEDELPPETAITSPAVQEVVRTSSVLVEGSALDESSVGRVQIAIKDRDSALWLRADGSWGGYERLSAVLQSAGASSTVWSRSVQLPDGNFYVEAFATDAAGNVDLAKSRRQFSVSASPLVSDTQPPDTTISAPQKNATLTSLPATLSGTATDNVAVAKVQVAVKDRGTGLWLRTDGTWGSFVRLDALTAALETSGTTWWLDVGLPSGSYYMQAGATDTSGLKDGSNAETTFVVDIP